MRAHHAYRDIFEPVIGTTLSLQREPENARPHAVAIVEDTGSIVGHTPLGLSRIVSSFSKRANHKATAEICEERVNRGAGLGLEIPVIYKIYCRRKYVDWLDELIHGSEIAKRAVREKHEGILIDGRKTQKSTKKKYTWYVRKYSKMLIGVRYNERENNKIGTLGPNKCP